MIKIKVKEKNNKINFYQIIDNKVEKIFNTVEELREIPKMTINNNLNNLEVDTLLFINSSSNQMNLQNNNEGIELINYSGY